MEPWAKHGDARRAGMALLLAVIFVGQLARNSAAQEATPGVVGEPAPRAAKTHEDGGAAGRIQYVGPDTYILLDGEGRPQAMPGMTYEDFMEVWRKSNLAHANERQPRYTIENVDVTGTTNGDHAKLRFEASVRLLSEEPVSVPLGLTGTILEGQPRFEAEGAKPEEKSEKKLSASLPTRQEYLENDPGRGGLVAHLAGRAGERRKVTLDLFVPLVRNGDETMLALNCPRALAATLRLDVDGVVSEANVSNGALLSEDRSENGKTRLTAGGLAGEFQLTWSTARAAEAELSTVLSATGAIQMTIDGRSVRSDARLTVRSYGGTFDRFRVRLPAGATLIQNRALSGDKDPGYRIVLEDEARAEATAKPGSPSGRIVQVQLPAKQQGPVVVELSTEQPLILADGDVAVQLGGFDVLGAVRQFGDVAVRVADQWQARIDGGEFVRRVDTSELEPALQQPGLTGAFQYDGQPWSLGARVSARRIRVQVTPEYDLEVFPDECRLRAHFTYQILSARAHEFQLNLRGWERTADPVESGGLIDRDRIALSEDGNLVLPLTQASLRRAEITVYLRRPVPRDARQLSLPLPLPAAESVATGTLVVRSAPGVELTPDPERTKGLAPIAVTARGIEEHIENRELQYRCSAPDAQFAAARGSRSREVAVGIAAHVDMGVDRAHVRQRVEYSVRFEPLSELVFDVPSVLNLEDATAEVALVSTSWDADGDTRERGPETPLRVASLADESELPIEGREHQVRVVLPQPRLGRFAIELRYTVERPQSFARSPSWTIPLARPIDGRSSEWRAAVRSPRELTVTVDEAGGTKWKEVDPPQTSAPGGGKEFVSTQSEIALPLVLRAMDGNQPSSTFVERAWLQTWLTGNARQDRAAFHFRTSGRLVSIELPPETAAEEVEVLLDGERADVIAREAGRIVVQVAAPPGKRGGEPESFDEVHSHTLELRSRRASTDRVLTRRRLTPPQLVGMKGLTHVYWHIVLPGDRHVIDSPPQLAAADEWQWLGNFWGRRPTHTQAELEQWVGATNQQAPTTAQNEYLYSGLAPVSSIEIVTAPRWLIVLASSGAVLALACAWLYTPGLRRRWVAGAAACVLAALAVAYPTPAMLLGQAALLGIVLAALAAFISRFAARPMQWHLPMPGGSSHRQLTSQIAPRPESIVMGSLASAVASTSPTAPLPVSESER